MNILKKLFKFGGNSDFGILINSIISIIGAFIIILLWHFISIYELIPTNILPDPFKVISCIPSLITDNYLFANMWYTVKLNLSCYIYAILISFPIVNIWESLIQKAKLILFMENNLKVL